MSIPTQAAPTRAAVLLPWEHGGRNGPREAEARLAEAIGLTASIGLVIAHDEIVQIRAHRPATLFGEGQVRRIGESIAEAEIGVAVVDSTLSPVQQRNLERAWKCKVIDRTGLILDIFGERARTAEGVLQVELAHLAYQRSRLVRSWTHLERQRGGFGFLGGPGETQIEADRRLITDRIARLRRELDEVRRTRALHRAARNRVPYPVVALVGYTNAGKSTLFNALTGATVHAQVYPQSVRAGEAHPHEVRIAFDGDAVLFSDEAERVYQREGLPGFTRHETRKAALPLPPGPFKPLLEALHRLQHAASSGATAMRLRTALVTARSSPAHERAVRTLMAWNIAIDEAMFLGGLDKGPFLREFQPDFFFDDQTRHVESAARHVPAGRVHSGVHEQAGGRKLR
ncbi:MAG: GTPase HflX [Rhodospirillales bacterium]|nr:GTPase HflX [Rhodospirillales bacterium]